MVDTTGAMIIYSSIHHTLAVDRGGIHVGVV